MTASRIPQGQLRFDAPHANAASLGFGAATLPADDTLLEDVSAAVKRTRTHLLDAQHAEGYWLGELEGDTILESEYILLLAWMGRERSEVAIAAAEYIKQQQLPDGGWAQYPGGPLEISGSVKAYFALKLTGHDPAVDYMDRARRAILASGGAEKVNSFTRYYLALLGVIAYRQCPAVPPELLLLPTWMPFNIYEMSAWSRTILVPLSLLWAHQPVRPISEELGIRELFLTSPEELPVAMPPCDQLDDLQQRTWIDWAGLFRLGDRVWKLAETCGLKPLRSMAVLQAREWMLERFSHSDGLGAIFPPIIWSVVALRCLGYEEDSPEVAGQLAELEKLTIREGTTVRLEPCRSPVWDTALTTLALREAGVSTSHPAIRKSVDWLLSKEVRQPGDWSKTHPDVEPGGWYFEFNNEFYPDVDDTIMVTMALAASLPGERHEQWTASLIPRGHQSQSVEPDIATVISGRSGNIGGALADVERMTPMLAAIRRGVRWTLAMQSRNGGWGAFDADNDRELLTRVPFADHNAMIDPPTADITARVLEMFGRLGVEASHPVIERAKAFVWQGQEADDCWYGRWGVNYVYGTWQVIVGLTQVGVSPRDARIQAAADWLKAHQQPCGGWGETPRSYDEPDLRGEGPVTASQTAWALMGLMAAGGIDSESVQRGIEYLMSTQNTDGTWDEEPFTGTGFPRVFYLRYHMYRLYFPLMALARYARQLGERET